IFIGFSQIFLNFLPGGFLQSQIGKIFLSIAVIFLLSIWSTRMGVATVLKRTFIKQEDVLKISFWVGFIPFLLGMGLFTLGKIVIPDFKLSGLIVNFIDSIFSAISYGFFTNFWLKRLNSKIQSKSSAVFTSPVVAGPIGSQLKKGLIIGLILVSALVAYAFLGQAFQQKVINKSLKQLLPLSDNSANETADWKTFSVTGPGGFQFKYPPYYEVDSGMRRQDFSDSRDANNMRLSLVFYDMNINDVKDDFKSFGSEVVSVEGKEIVYYSLGEHNQLEKIYLIPLQELKTLKITVIITEYGSLPFGDQSKLFDQILSTFRFAEKEEHQEITNKSLIKLISPNGGEQLEKWKQYTIQWECQNFSPDNHYFARLYLIGDGSAHWGLINGTPESLKYSACSKSNKNSIVWEVGQVERGVPQAGIKYQIRIDIVDSKDIIIASDKSDNYFSIQSAPIINNVSPQFGPIGTVMELRGNDFSGFEGDLIAIFENTDGVNGVIYGESGSNNNLIKFKLPSSLCQVNVSYSGLPCSALLNLLPGVYKIYVIPWGKKSNEVLFTIK
ncbi:MAG: hypothetical protein Q7R84_02605, partial [bacterium]|nr:hypothetical protein [bacterium]